MTWGAVIVAGASLVGGAVSSRGAKKGAKAVEESSAASIAEQRAAREQFITRTQPFVDLGTGASKRLGEFLGISAAPSGQSAERQQLQQQLTQLQNIPQTINGQPLPQGNIQRQIGLIQNQLAQLDESPIEGDFIPAGEQRAFEINPIIDILRQEGFEDIQESAAARGRLGAGDTQLDLARFNERLATVNAPALIAAEEGLRSQRRSQTFNELFNVAGLGANAAAGQGTAGIQTASNIQNALATSGQAQQTGAIQQANAVTGAVQNLAGVAGAFPSLFGGSTPPPQVNPIQTPLPGGPGTSSFGSAVASQSFPGIF